MIAVTAQRYKSYSRHVTVEVGTPQTRGVPCLGPSCVACEITIETLPRLLFSGTGYISVFLAEFCKIFLTSERNKPYSEYTRGLCTVIVYEYDVTN